MNKISQTVETEIFNGVEKELMNKRVFGVSIIGAKMANWNAGFDSDPKMTSNNEIYGSDKAMKFSIRQHWVNQNKKVLFFKEMVEKKGKIVPMSLQERFLKLNNLEKMPKDEKESIDTRQRTPSESPIQWEVNVGATFRSLFFYLDTKHMFSVK